MVVFLILFLIKPNTLLMIKMSTKAPRGCELYEPAKSPLKINAIDFPSPHPGQFSIPAKLNKHRSICFGSYGFIKDK